MDQMPTLSATKIDPLLRIHEMKTAPEVREYSEISWKNDDVCQWTTSLKVPIRSMKKLLPTFLNQLSARQYAVVVQLSIKGLFHGILELVLPVQVIYYPGLAEILEMPLREVTEARDQLLSPLSNLQQDFMASDVYFLPPSYDL